MKTTRGVVRIILVLLSIFSVFGAFNALAKDAVFEVANVEILEKTSGVIVNDVSLSSDYINNDIVLTDKNDYIKYKITIKNLSKSGYTLKSISVDDNSPYLDYVCDGVVNAKVEAGATKDFLLLISYKNESRDLNISMKKINLLITYEDEGGEDSPDKNPDTIDKLYVYAALFAVSSIGIIATFVKKKNRGKMIVVALVVSAVVTPQTTKAYSDSFTITINNQIKARQYNVILDKDNGEPEEIIQIVKGNTITDVEVPSKTGHDFAGWYKDDELYDLSTPVLGDLTIKAKYRINKYKISFDTDGGTEIPPIIQDYDSLVTAPSNPTKTGYTFKQWNQDIPERMPARDLTIKAIWDEDPVYNFYNVVFDSDGGTTVDSQRVIENGKAIEPRSPTKPDYVFGGWYLDGILYDFDTPVTKNITLVAEWNWDPSIIRYKVTFDSNKGTEVESQKIAENQKAVRPQDPYRYGYKLQGWYLDGVLFDFDTPITKNTHLVAEWEEDPAAVRLTVIFDSDGGSAIPSQRVIAGDFATRPENPTRANYAFVGWHEIIDPYIFPDVFDFDNERIVYDNTRLIAFWEPAGEKHLVKFDTGEGGSFVPDQLVINGQKANQPIDPTKDGVGFKEWQLDGSTYDFDTPVFNPITLTAKWVHMCGDYEIVEGKYDNEGRKIDFKYSDCFFTENPSTYNNHMATMSQNLAQASNHYINNGDYSNGAKNVIDILDQSGFGDVYVSETYKMKPFTDTIGYAIASKDINTRDGNKKVISITVRSAGYEKEWASNVTLGKTGEALGFKSAALQVLAGVDEYISNYNLDQIQADGDLIFWIQGFSRGGATANLTAKELIDRYSPSGNTVYAYCIEAPQGGLSSLETGDYGSIHNVVNVDDLVPYVAPLGMGFKRYGIDHYLVNDEHGWQVAGIGHNVADNSPFYVVREEQLEKVDDQLKQIFNGSDVWKDYRPYSIKSKHINSMFYYMSDADRQEPTISFLYRFMQGVTQDTQGEPVITREDYVDEGIQDALRRLMMYLNSDVNFEEFLDALKLSDFVSISGGEAIVAVLMTMMRAETADGVIKLKLNHSPVIRYLYASAIRDTIAGNDEVMNLLNNYPGGNTNALDDIETVIYNVLKVCDDVDDFATFLTNATGVLINHKTATTLAWLRSYDSWYYGDYN